MSERMEPLLINARNAQQAEYLVRSRAEQRGVDIDRIEVSDAGSDTWLVTVISKDEAKSRAARLADDTQIFRLDARDHR